MKAEIIGFDKCLYTSVLLEKKRLSKSELENMLFEKAISQLELENAYNYTFSYYLTQDKAHLFLCEEDFLDKHSEIAICEAFLYKNLSQIYKQKIQAVLMIRQNYAFILFVQDDDLLLCKHIPSLSQSLLAGKTKQEQDLLYKEILQDFLHLDELCKDYKCELLLVFDESTRAFCQSLALPCQKCSSEELTQRLLSYQNKLKISSSANFLRHHRHLSLFKSLVLGFFFVFALSFAYEFYTLYQTEQEQIAQNALNLRQSQDTSKIAEALKEKSALLKELEIFTKKAHIIQKFGLLFDFFHSHQSFIESVEFDDKIFKIFLKNPSQSLINELYTSKDFTLKLKEEKEGLTLLYIEFLR